MNPRNMKEQTVWLFKMAWRDSRRSRSRLFLFISSIILGIAALVAIYSFSDNLNRDITIQAAGLTGADLIISDNQQPSAATVTYLSKLGDARSSEKSFASMVLFTRNGASRLVQVRALEGGFPYYGEIETSPASAARTFKTGNCALVDKTLILQYGAANGDSIKLGTETFAIAGTLNGAPGQTGFASAIAPIIYIPLATLEKTGLLQKGSRINYTYYYKYNRPEQLTRELKTIRKNAEKASMEVETIESRKENTGDSFRNMTKFLSLVGFVALLLGCIGVASAVHIYVREKLASVSILRCLGASASQSFLIYLIQIVIIGFVGSILGALLGTLIQQLLPLILKDFLPLEITSRISPLAIVQGIVTGLIVSFLFSLLPLLAVRKVSPLNTLRAGLNEDKIAQDPLKWVIYLAIIAFMAGFSYLQLRELKQALFFTGGIIFAFLILAGIAQLLIWLVRRYFPESWSYLWRQGLSNLFRPNNQTLILIVCIGLGTSFIGTLLLVQDVLIKKVSSSSSENKPNMVLFDIQTTQKEAIADLTKSFQLPVIQQVPIVTMRIEEIRGITAAQAKKDSSLDISPRSYNSEIRATFRKELTPTEKITAGKWVGQVQADDKEIKISLESKYAERLHVKVGDKMLFNVQGAPIPVEVGSLREVDWNNIQTNFRVVFPAGVLESAPQFHVLITRLGTPEQAAAFQQAVIRNFPNVSIIDLNLVLNILDEIMSKIGFVIRFMAGFSIITGIVVLITSVLISKYQRSREVVLLRTLGASSKQILVITGMEYFFLGAFAAFTGIILSFAAAWALAKYNFETDFSPQLVPVLILFFCVCILTVAIGLFNSRSSLNGSPLEVLRKEI